MEKGHVENRLADEALRDDRQRRKSRALASKFSIFTGVLLSWVVLTTICWDLLRHTFSLAKGLIDGGDRYGNFAFYDPRAYPPLKLLEAGIKSMVEGHPEPIQVSRTGDEIESLGESINQMIQALAIYREEIREHHERLEERIRQRTGELEIAKDAAACRQPGQERISGQYVA